jgi:DNA polymerase-3 subunit alpha
MLAAEKAALGFYISGHPLERYLDILQNVKAVSSSDLPNLNTGSRVTVGGIIAELQTRTTKKGDKFALLRLEDESGGTKCVLWPEVYRKHSTLLQNELPVVIMGRLELSEDNPPTIIVDQVRSIDAAVRDNEYLVLRAPTKHDLAELCDSILDLLHANPGDCDVTLEALTEKGMLVRIKASEQLRVTRSAELEEALKKLGLGVRVETNGTHARV